MVAVDDGVFIVTGTNHRQAQQNVAGKVEGVVPIVFEERGDGLLAVFTVAPVQHDEGQFAA
ncbi:hypothetical protein D3C79_988070 [compost metagenome]